jgi:hypothetical protein
VGSASVNRFCRQSCVLFIGLQAPVESEPENNPLKGRYAKAKPWGDDCDEISKVPPTGART